MAQSAKQIEIGSILVSEIMTIPTEDSKYDSSDTEDDGRLLRVEPSAQKKLGTIKFCKNIQLMDLF